ncbi:chemotaxis protein CheB [Deinococcus apachensis]|uniref:chemotaxis protein CheB n=1 Tax=Deinococcus apachensis TaxID=309886 RepID=UPI0009FF40C8
MPPPLIVIGGSAGALPALLKLVPVLPPDFPAPLLLVVHTLADQPSYLPQLLTHAGPLPARHARHGDRLQPGSIAVAPPDHHLLVVDDHLHLSRGPKENLARPAIDVLFRSAAEAYGVQVIGVLLSGMLNDGTSGLWTVGQLGGRTLVQHPEPGGGRVLRDASECPAPCGGESNPADPRDRPPAGRPASADDRRGR